MREDTELDPYNYRNLYLVIFPGKFRGRRYEEAVVSGPIGISRSRSASAPEELTSVLGEYGFTPEESNLVYLYATGKELPGADGDAIDYGPLLRVSGDDPYRQKKNRTGTQFFR